MPVGLTIATKLSPVPGVKIAVGQAGIKKKNKNDVTIFEICEGANTAAVFTKNRFCAAPVILSKKHIAETKPKYLLINTGNANAGTGEDGLSRAQSTCQALAQLTGCKDNQILPFSTGVIGEPLPSEKIVNVLADTLSHLKEDAWMDAAAGIMTTDTVPKGFSTSFKLNDEEIVISGIAKGAGMIKPNMATMLSYVATNATISQSVLQKMLVAAVDLSFNSVTVDSDTSTNDACVLIASGKTQFEINDLESPHAQLFQKELQKVFIFLAQALVRDGEGATKFIAVNVKQGKSLEECRLIAYAIAHSPLVKTAFFACDPNWGRILAAVGRAGVDDLDVQRINIFLDDVCIVKHGARAASYTEEQGQKVMKQQDINITVELDRGMSEATVWTCDFSYDYVKINAEYRS